MWYVAALNWRREKAERFDKVFFVISVIIVLSILLFFIFTWISFVRNTLFFKFFFFNLSFYKKFVTDCILYILKLNLINFFGTVIILTSTKNKLIIIIKMIIIMKIWNLWAALSLYLYMYPKTFVSEACWHQELRFRSLSKEVFL